MADGSVKEITLKNNMGENKIGLVVEKGVLNEQEVNFAKKMSVDFFSSGVDKNFVETQAAKIIDVVFPNDLSNEARNVKLDSLARVIWVAEHDSDSFKGRDQITSQELIDSLPQAFRKLPDLNRRLVELQETLNISVNGDNLDAPVGNASEAPASIKALEAPETSETPAISTAPEAPEAPATSEVPETSETPAISTAPEAPATTTTTEASGTTTIPEAPVTSTTPETPVTSLSEDTDSKIILGESVFDKKSEWKKSRDDKPKGNESGEKKTEKTPELIIVRDLPTIKRDGVKTEEFVETPSGETEIRIEGKGTNLLELMSAMENGENRLAMMDLEELILNGEKENLIKIMNNMDKADRDTVARIFGKKIPGMGEPMTTVAEKQELTKVRREFAEHVFKKGLDIEEVKYYAKELAKTYAEFFDRNGDSWREWFVKDMASAIKDGGNEDFIKALKSGDWSAVKDLLPDIFTSKDIFKGKIQKKIEVNRKEINVNSKKVSEVGDILNKESEEIDFSNMNSAADNISGEVSEPVKPDETGDIYFDMDAIHDVADEITNAGSGKDKTTKEEVKKTESKPKDGKEGSTKNSEKKKVVKEGEKKKEKRIEEYLQESMESVVGKNKLVGKDLEFYQNKVRRAKSNLFGNLSATGIEKSKKLVDKYISDFKYLFDGSEENNKLLGRIFTEAIIKSNNHALKEALMFGSVYEISRLIPPQIRKWTEAIRGTVVNDKGLIESIDKFDKLYTSLYPPENMLQNLSNLDIGGEDIWNVEVYKKELSNLEGTMVDGANKAQKEMMVKAFKSEIEKMSNEENQNVGEEIIVGNPKGETMERNESGEVKELSDYREMKIKYEELAFNRTWTEEERASKIKEFREKYEPWFANPSNNKFFELDLATGVMSNNIEDFFEKAPGTKEEYIEFSKMLTASKKIVMNKELSDEERKVLVEEFKNKYGSWFDENNESINPFFRLAVESGQYNGDIKVYTSKAEL